ncbi:DUF6177 family protein [Streptomyces xanthochromogenes]|uniref:Uncharacterized protein n=1 Tax=Streptomyces xanthochromogenes TaxID=67384 RepID=A0ABQ3AWH6_9ACTN|nr:DUF6177 family protein [Streptomyces xanthochromogenes]GGY66389.1 hypothetical protein GCM10010326_71270 [Streptomyces xanthochromogenes]
MTKDVIALTPTMPDPSTVLAGLYAGGPGLRVNTLADGAVLQLCTADGAPIVSVEAPHLVHHPHEARRLLGDQVPLPEGPFWWTEARANTAVPEGERLAASFAGRLTTVLGGAVWPPHVAHTDVVPTTGLTPSTTLGDLPPAVDIQTDHASVILQDRPVIALTTWLSDALRAAAADGRALQLVTPPSCRLTQPTRTALAAHPNRWVVQDPEHGYCDGLSGLQLRWHKDAFAPTLDESGNACLAEPFKSPESSADASGEQQLLLSIRTVQPAAEDLLLGGALEAAWHHLTGAGPAGWGTAEPVNLPWSRRQLSGLARTRAQRSASTWLLAVGGPERPGIATTQVLHTSAGIEEHIAFALGYAAGSPPPLAALPELGRLLATRHNLVTMLTTLRTGRRDLTVPAHFEAPPVPVSFTAGPDVVRQAGLAHAEARPPHPAPTRLGPAAAPALHYSLGDGTDPGAWAGLRQIIHHLK